MNLLERIDEIQANSVTPEEFEETWGKSLEQYKSELADYVERLYEERRAEAEVVDHPAEVSHRPAAAPAAAAEAAAATVETEGQNERCESKKTESASLQEVAATIKALAKKLATMRIISKKEESGKCKEKGRRLVKEKGIDNWELKLVAVPTGCGRTLAKGAPVVIRSLDAPAEDGRIVARVCIPGKKEKMILPKMTEGMKGLMVDVGGLKVGDLVGMTPGKEPKMPGVKGPKEPGGSIGPKM